MFPNEVVVTLGIIFPVYYTVYRHGGAFPENYCVHNFFLSIRSGRYVYETVKTFFLSKYLWLWDFFFPL